MSTILQAASNGIATWNEVRNNTVAANNYFNNGAYFSISKSDYATWKSKWEGLNRPSNFNIHAYLALENHNYAATFSLCLFCVDSRTDKLSVEGNENEYLLNLKHASFHAATLSNPIFNMNLLSINTLDPLEALQRSTLWTFHKETWLLQQTNMTQILVIPFKDLTVLFDNPAVDAVICQPALTDGPTSGTFQMDMIIWGHSDTGGIVGKYPQDLIQPKPPYSVAPSIAYNLLVYSV